jgi:hypothetical protein
LAVFFALLSDIFNFSEDHLFDGGRVVVKQVSHLQQACSSFADLLVKQPNANNQVRQFNELD